MKTPVITMRLDEVMQALMQSCIDRHNSQPSCVPWSMTDFIRSAIKDKIAHINRSRTKRRNPIEDVRYTIAEPEDVQGCTTVE